MPKPANNQSNKRRPQKRGGRKRSNYSNLPEGLPADVEEYGEDLAALEEADGEEINIGHLQKKDIAELNAMAKEMEVENFGTMRKHEMIFQILRKHAEPQPLVLYATSRGERQRAAQSLEERRLARAVGAAKNESLPASQLHLDAAQDDGGTDRVRNLRALERERADAARWRLGERQPRRPTLRDDERLRLLHLRPELIEGLERDGGL